MSGILVLGLLLVAFAWTPPATASDAAGTGDLCQTATASAEHSTGVPDQLLGAISRVETGRTDAETDTVRAWPWTINAQGIGHFYTSKSEAVTAARDFQTAGIRSIDVGCMQINLMFHPDGFTSLDQAFDPGANAIYAARFLTDLFHQTGSWPHAAAAYHSQTPNLGSDYQRKVLEAWAEPTGGATASPRHDHATAAPASVAASSGSGPGFSRRPLGGFGHIVRDQASAPVRTVFTAGGGGRSLATYRSVPVSLASLPPHALHE
ncbi:lytic transglycosylase domain-containing protein [Lichenicola cladoniae]|uniref:Lytic transglycosylase domain-containing protein n=1 Tax=Lichenicola cladoniae TaxID=1484109 RepID=A0A6M8HQ56_9PROT|nr:lytic transglycosylase domain-containing protein [Lichenicola cladoniae]NPD67881.1 lytic transglycosylase domain-containing protein [Acetobacteraceae bacterium]QKE90482.1 lytic transglycosylase domain-containing protein [Lichenicola cladoniae]